MKTVSLIVTLATAAAALLAFSAPAAAQEATYEYPQAVVVGKTRAEVKAELAAAIASGERVVGEVGYSFGDSRSELRRVPAAAVATDAQPMARAKSGMARVRAELNTANFEPQSFDGVVTAAGGAIGAPAIRSN